MKNDSKKEIKKQGWDTLQNHHLSQYHIILYHSSVRLQGKLELH